MEKQQVKLTFNSAVGEVQAERRIIAGKIVPWGEIGYTSAGPVMFERGSIQIPDTAKVKLLMQHDESKVLGRAQSFNTTDDGIYASFKVSNSTRGTDALTLAGEDLVSGLSVGVEVTASRPVDNYLLVTAARLMETSLVSIPAFENAQVTRVAASESIADEVPQTQQQESEAVMTTVPEDVTPEQEPAEVVEASRPRITTTSYNPLNAQTVRHGITSMSKYTQHKVQAALGNQESALWVQASEDPMVVRAAADSIGTTNPAFNPVQYLNEFITFNNFGRPAIDACSRGVLPSQGMTFSIPKLTTAPVVSSTAEAAAPTDTGMVSAYLTGTVTKYAGQNTVSLELLERSSENPAFYNELTTQMERAYLAATDAAMIAALTAGGTISTVSSAATSAGIISFISTQAPLVYSGTSYFAQNYLAGTSQWGLLLGAVDSTGRPIYSANQPMNAAGAVNPSSIKGQVLGLDLYVDKNVVATTIDESAFIIAPETVTWYESPTAYFSVNIVSSMSVQMAIYGYGSALVKQSAGIRRFALT